MIMMRHTGIYVKDLEKMEAFYRTVFSMKVIFQGTAQADPLIADLLEAEDGEVKISKLITEYGEEKKAGDMLELVQVVNPVREGEELPYDRPVRAAGMNHIAFGVEDLEETVKLALLQGGKLKTKIHSMENGRKCAFLTDPEGNWIELIR